MKPRESAENYLETILMLSQSENPVRSIDIVNELSFSKPSISNAMKHLKAEGHIVMDVNGHITLTESGREIAERVYDRHILISNWLISLGVDRETATNDACRIEHDISEKSFSAIKQFLEKQ